MTDYFFPLPPKARRSDRGLLLMNHEFAKSFLLFPDGDPGGMKQATSSSMNCPTADVYVLMEVLHDCADEECVAILSAIRRAARDDPTLLVIEGVIPEETD